jgi:hypothetical protein
MAHETGLERTRLVIRGVRSELRVEDGRVTIEKEAPTPSQVVFGIEQIRGTSLDLPSPVGRGWVHLAVVEGSTTPASELAAMADPYTLPITARSSGAARRLARLVDKHLRERGLPSEAAFAGAPPSDGRYSTGVALTSVPPPGPAQPTPPEARTGTAASAAHGPRSGERPADELASDEVATDGPVSDERAFDELVSDGPVPDELVSDEVVSDEVASETRGVTAARELVAELTQLAGLHAAGALTDEEFRHAKRRVLG